MVISVISIILALGLQVIPIVEILFSFALLQSGNVTITSPANQDAKINGKGIYSGPMNITISNWTNGTITNGVGVGVINPNAKYTKVDGKLVFLEGVESEQITVTGQISTQPYVDSKVITVKINNAGQDGVKGE